MIFLEVNVFATLICSVGPKETNTLSSGDAHTYNVWQFRVSGTPNDCSFTSSGLFKTISEGILTRDAICGSFQCTTQLSRTAVLLPSPPPWFAPLFFPPTRAGDGGVQGKWPRAPHTLSDFGVYPGNRIGAIFFVKIQMFHWDLISVPIIQPKCKRKITNSPGKWTNKWKCKIFILEQMLVDLQDCKLH